MRSVLPWLRREVCGPALPAIFVSALFICCFATFVAAAPTFPSLSGRVVDEAGLLSPDAITKMEADLSALETASSDQVVVVTLRSLQGYDIADYGYQLGRAWGVGQAGKDNGVLFIVAPNERKVRIEVGRGLEPILTDLMSKIIIENAILPEFRRGDFPAGIQAGVRDIKATLLGDAEGVKARARGRDDHDPDWVPVVIFLVWLSFVAFIIYANHQQRKRRRLASNAGASERSRKSNRDRSDDLIFGPGGSAGHWNSGGWSSGGGGWSGGGGSFGGGGSSGSW